MATPRRSRRQMLELHARALMALHRIYERSDETSYGFTVLVLENLAAWRRRVTKAARAAEEESWLRRQLAGLGKDGG